jgi:hypothetical protein
MAQIDSRLQPLLAVLNEAGYDWIVSEILEALSQGRPRLASEEELRAVRAKIETQDDSPEEDTSGDSDTEESLLGDDQISVAVKLVTSRFENMATMLSAARKNLHLIAMHSEPSRPEPSIAFQIDSETRPIASGAAREFSEQVASLNASIESWYHSVRSQTGEAQ